MSDEDRRIQKVLKAIFIENWDDYKQVFIDTLEDYAAAWGEDLETVPVDELVDTMQGIVANNLRSKKQKLLTSTVPESSEPFVNPLVYRDTTNERI